MTASKIETLLELVATLMGSLAGAALMYLFYGTKWAAGVFIISCLGGAAVTRWDEWKREQRMAAEW